MRVNGETCQSIWFDEGSQQVKIIDQTLLPHQFVSLTLDSLAATTQAIVSMQVRGAPLIGITAAFGVYLALRNKEADLETACQRLLLTRPTAVNLHWALQRVLTEVSAQDPGRQTASALNIARQLWQEDADSCSAIGENGLQILQDLWQHKSAQSSGAVSCLNILTHCNAGWLATADWGTALAPIYKAHLQGIPVHVWVDETRPRNQGASLTAWELQRQGIAHTVIVDNAGGHLMQHGQVDVCIVGSDRTTANGDVCNKIGTYLKALAAVDNGIPFYAALPVSTIDFTMHDGIKEIPIEERDSKEVSHMQGPDAQGQMHQVQVTPSGTRISNYGFDVTPARLVTGLITEQGVFPATPAGLAAIKNAATKHVTK